MTITENSLAALARSFGSIVNSIGWVLIWLGFCRFYLKESPKPFTVTLICIRIEALYAFAHLLHCPRAGL